MSRINYPSDQQIFKMSAEYTHPHVTIAVCKDLINMIKKMNQPCINCGYNNDLTVITNTKCANCEKEI